jgi:hypothetical protein
VYSESERAVTTAERRRLAARARQVERRYRRAWAQAAAGSALVCGVLGALTLAASDAPRLVIVVFWIGMTALFTLWVGADERRALRRLRAGAAAAAAATRAREVRIRSSAVIAFDEIEDEGACYAFAFDAGRMIFIAGQEFYSTPRFPNDDFSLVEAIDDRGRALDAWTDIHGQPLTPVRTIPAAIKRSLEIPDHLTIVDATPEDIEQQLRRI